MRLSAGTTSLRHGRIQLINARRSSRLAHGVSERADKVAHFEQGVEPAEVLPSLGALVLLIERRDQRLAEVRGARNLLARLQHRLELDHDDGMPERDERARKIADLEVLLDAIEPNVDRRARQVRRLS